MLLEDIADPTAVLRDEKPVLAVDQDLSVYDDAPTVRAQQSADDVDQRRLAGAGAPPPQSRARRSTASIDSLIARTNNGKPMTPDASAAPVQRNANTSPIVCSSS